MKIIKREGNKATLNLTIPFAIWAGVWLLVALAFQEWAMVWVAFMPMILWFGFFVFVWFAAAVGFALAYLSGKPIEWTNTKGDKRIIQRRR